MGKLCMFPQRIALLEQALRISKREIKLQRNIGRNKNKRWFINVCN